MAHTLVLGRTMYGKSSYCKWLSRELHNAEVPVGVLNPQGETGWPCDMQSKDPAIVKAWAQLPFKKALFLDECGMALQKDPQWNWFTTTARHRGCSTWAIAHRLQDITPTLRGQCTELVLFRCSLSDARDLSDEYGDSSLREAAEFEVGDFFMVGRGGTRRGKLQWVGKTVQMDFG